MFRSLLSIYRPISHSLRVTINMTGIKALWISLLLFICCSISPIIAQDDIDATAQPTPRPMPTSVIQAGNLQAELYFPGITQGGVGLVRLTGEGITGGRVFFLNSEYVFFQTTGDDWYAFLVVNMDTQARLYDFSMLAQTTSGDVTINAQVNIESAGYISQNFDIPGDRAYLADPEIERNEFARIDAITENITLERLWGDTSFDVPLDTEITSGFGTYRVLNQAMQTRHTGWDNNAPVGTPIKAIAAGKVVFAGAIDIRGNYVMIDHGYGVYSGYAHFSQVHVTRGQTIEKGQIIGMSGNTGRSSGPHLHWEMIVNGEWIDGLAFVNMWLP